MPPKRHPNTAPKRSRTCPICHKTFARAGGVRQHVQGIHGSNLQCPIPGCGFVTTWPRNLKCHSDNANLHANLSLPQPQNELKKVPALMPFLPTYPTSSANCTQTGVLQERPSYGNQTLYLETCSQALRSYPQASSTPQYPLPTSLAQYDVFNDENLRPGSYSLEQYDVGTWTTDNALWCNNGSGVWGLCMHRVLAEECSICVWGWA